MQGPGSPDRQPAGARRLVPGIIRVAALAGLVIGVVTWMVSRPSRQERPTAAERRPTAEGDLAEPPIVTPVRSSAHARPSFQLPEVPAMLEGAPAVTVEIETGGTAEGSERKTITRTADRVHVTIGPGGPEWLFVRNPRDGRRVSAMMVDHVEHLVVEYDESELRNQGLGRGWADIATLGVEPEAFAQLRPTGRRRTLAGLAAVELRLPEGVAGRIGELWWSDEARLPLRMSLEGRGAAGEVVVRAVRLVADQALLRDPRERYSTYPVIDAADLREKHHERSRRDRPVGAGSQPDLRHGAGAAPG